MYITVRLEISTLEKRSRLKMATASRIVLSPKHTGVFSVQGLSEESARKASELLQENHGKYHIYFKMGVFHNHIAHHILSLFALGASPAVMEEQYGRNTRYQMPQFPVDDRVVEDLRDPGKYLKYMGDEKYYQDYLVFFKSEIEKKGYEAVVNEYVLQGDEKADHMLAIMFAGFLHPIIHLGFGVEFQQPSIVAEALAQAVTHDPYLNPLLFEAERLANARRSSTSGKSLVAILDEIQEDPKMRGACAFGQDARTVEDGILVRAAKEMTEYCGRYFVEAEELEMRVAEMMNFGGRLSLLLREPFSRMLEDGLKWEKRIFLGQPNVRRKKSNSTSSPSMRPTAPSFTRLSCSNHGSLPPIKSVSLNTNPASTLSSTSPVAARPLTSPKSQITHLAATTVIPGKASSTACSNMKMMGMRRSC